MSKPNRKSSNYLIVIVSIVSVLVAVVLPASVTRAAPSYWVVRPESGLSDVPPLPPRPTAQPIPTFPPRPTAEPPAPAGAAQPQPGGFIELRLQAPQGWSSANWLALWTVVQRQNDMGEWRDVEEWQGAFDEVLDGEGRKTWWVAEEDFGYGPFRWTVYEDRGGSLLAHSETFYLPTADRQTVRVDVVVTAIETASKPLQASEASADVDRASAAPGAAAGGAAMISDVVDQAAQPEGTWRANRYTAQTAGTWVVQGTYKGQEVQVVLNVKPGELSRILLSPGEAAVTAGGSHGFTAEAYDAYGNLLGDVTSDTDFTIVESGHGGDWIANRYVAHAAGTWTVRGQYEGMSADVGLDVAAGQLGYIAVSPGAATATAGADQSFTAEAFDVYGNSLGDVTADTSFLIIEWGHNGSWMDNAYSAHTAGTWTVRGNYAGRTADVGLVVNPAAPSLIAMSPGAAIVTAGETNDYAVEAFDAFGNSLGDVTASAAFRIVESGHRGSWTGNTYFTHGAGVWTVEGSYAGSTADAALTVRPAGLNYIVMSPDRVIVTAGEAQAFAAEAFDAYDNPLGDVTAVTVFDIVESGHSGHWGGKFYNAHTAGDWTVRGSYMGLTADTGLTVQPGELSYVVISPDASTVVAGQEQTFRAEAFDAYDNSLGDVTDETVFTVLASGQGDY